MCEICGKWECPSSCPNAHEEQMRCAVCGEDVYLYDASETLADGECICTICAEDTDEDMLDEVRAAHIRREIRSFISCMEGVKL